MESVLVVDAWYTLIVEPMRPGIGFPEPRCLEGTLSELRFVTRYRDVFDPQSSQAVVDMEYLGQDMLLRNGPPVPRRRTDAEGLALAVLMGDNDAALALADLVTETYTGSREQGARRLARLAAEGMRDRCAEFAASYAHDPQSAELVEALRRMPPEDAAAAGQGTGPPR